MAIREVESDNYLGVKKKLCQNEPSVWYKHVDRVQRCINSTIQRSTKFSPFEVLLGMRQKEDINLMQILNEETVDQFLEYGEEIRGKAKA